MVAGFPCMRVIVSALWAPLVFSTISRICLWPGELDFQFAWQSEFHFIAPRLAPITMVTMQQAPPTV